MVIPRRFAIAAREVTVEQFQRFLTTVRITNQPLNQTTPGVSTSTAPIWIFAFCDDRCNPLKRGDEPCAFQPRRTLSAAEFWVPSAWSH